MQGSPSTFPSGVPVIAPRVRGGWVNGTALTGRIAAAEILTGTESSNLEEFRIRRFGCSDMRNTYLEHSCIPEREHRDIRMLRLRRLCMSGALEGELRKSDLENMCLRVGEL